MYICMYKFAYLIKSLKSGDLFIKSKTVFKIDTTEIIGTNRKDLHETTSFIHTHENRAFN